MKKRKLFVTFVLLALGSLLTFTACGGDKPITVDQLPNDVKQFVSTHFADAKIISAQKDGLEYELYLNNGFSLEFRNSGAWKEVDGNGTSIPESFLLTLPAGIATWVAENYSNRSIGKVKFEHNIYEVELLGGPELEIKFDAKGHFIRIDD